MQHRAWLGALALVIVGCHKENPLFCLDHPDDPSCVIDAMPDGPDSGCSTNDQCTAPTAVCDVDGSKMCVQCIAPDQVDGCSGTTPTCGSDDACRGCQAHGECSSTACLPDGSCGNDTNVAYVDPTGTDNAACTLAMPCTKVVKALATNRPFVKFTGTTSEQVTINNRDVTLLADPEAKLTSGSVGVILRVDGTSVVSIYDLEISDGLSGTGIGIAMPTGNTTNLTLTHVKLLKNAGGGVNANGGTLTVTQSTISGNTGGGLTISNAEFTLVNNMITSNGSATSLVGGLNIDGVGAGGTHDVLFNTISANVSSPTVNTGINCGTVTVPLTFSNNIIFANQVSGGGKQIGGSVNCATAFSDVGPDAATGTGNINADPLFVNAVTGDFHLSATSPCKDAADPAATLDVDIDGETRPQGSGRDIGADEAAP